MEAASEEHTIDEALARFDLIEGKGDGERTACVMSAISWVAGEAFTDSPKCAHPTLTSLAIRANDDDGTTKEQRADILRAGETGLLDTWWIPGEVIAFALSRSKPAEGETLPDETSVQRCMRVLAGVTAWKQSKERPNLGSADLRSADLRYADLRYADLRYADLGSADLRSADLGSANLGSANLRSANLRYADLRSADLGASLNWATAYGNKYTVLPDGWHIDEQTGLVVADGES